MSIAAMVDLARRENEAARKTWGAPAHSTTARTYHKNIAERVVPYIGSGYTLGFVARALGCSVPSVRNALRKLGDEL